MNSDEHEWEGALRLGQQARRRRRRPREARARAVTTHRMYFSMAMAEEPVRSASSAMASMAMAL